MAENQSFFYTVLLVPACKAVFPDNILFPQLPTATKLEKVSLALRDSVEVKEVSSMNPYL
jgi:hypothetical protein